MDISARIVHSGFDGKTCWVHARPAVIPGQAGQPPIILITTYPLRLTGNDVFYETHTMYSTDLGENWSALQASRDSLGRRPFPGGLEEICSDLVPIWHAASGKVLMTGHTVVYQNDELLPGLRPRSTVWSVLDPVTRTWSPYEKLQMPDPVKFYNCGAGSTQRVDLPNGELLLPVYYAGTQRLHSGGNCSLATVLRCSFDGKELRCLEYGTELTVPQPRGFGEPSLAMVNQQFFLTLRNDITGYVCCGTDGLHFNEPIPWCFDDGTNLGNYNTQQHWLTHEDRLFLIYTRRGANNDHVMRHRAPLFIAEVDQKKLCVIRDSEQILVPNRGARLGNFGVHPLSKNEYLVVVSEWMQTTNPDPFDYTVCQKYGSDNSIFMVKVIF